MRPNLCLIALLFVSGAIFDLNRYCVPNFQGRISWEIKRPIFRREKEK